MRRLGRNSWGCLVWLHLSLRWAWSSPQCLMEPWDKSLKVQSLVRGVSVPRLQDGDKERSLDDDSNTSQLKDIVALTIWCISGGQSLVTLRFLDQGIWNWCDL